MATRAFLLCGDEKAVHAVAQILDELEVPFEHSNEPPFALKRLAAQRFDLLIVDCDNVQNATQVFNSARASNLNKNSIAIAIVEGKAGVPNAFRLGASLVLTKPVSLEQTRNTLRTGIGMTRKDAVDSKHSVAAPLHAAPAPSIVPLAPPAVAPVPVSAAPAPVVPTPVAPSPAMAAPVAKAPAVLAPAAPAPLVPEVKTAAPVAPAVQKPVTPPSPAPEHKPALSDFKDTPSQPTVGVAAFAKAAAAASSSASTANKSDLTLSAGPATLEPTKVDAPKPKPVAVKEENLSDKAGNEPVLRIEDPLADEDEALDPIMDHGVPSFGGLGKQPFAGLEKGERSSSRRGLIAAVVLLLIGAGGYAAWATQPAFRNWVAWESTNAKLKIAALRGQTPTPVAAAKPQPAPVPPPPAAVPAPAPPTVTADGNPIPASSATPGTGQPETISLAIPPSATDTTKPTSTPTEPPAPKGPAVQSAKQDTTAGHAGSAPALVAASASLPTATAAKPANDLVEVPEDYADDQIVRRVHPVYPKQAKAKKLHGTVVLQAIVNKQGKVDSLQLVSGDPLLAQAAADAVKLWRYKPYSHNGEPADFQTRVTVDFKMPQ